jgi:hypothetical protein
MGNITIGGSKVLTITSASSKSFIIPAPLPPLPIVETMELNYQLSNNQWLFSLNGVTQDVKNLLDNGYTMQIQLVKERGYARRTSPSYNSQGIEYKKPTYPSYINDVAGGGILEAKKARVPINSFFSNNFVNMNLTNWVNNMFYYSSIPGSSLLNRSPVQRQISSTGYWFTKIGFCIIINNSKYAQTNYITLNMRNSQLPINTNYSMTNNIIDLVAL